MQYKISYSCVNHIGNVRSINQDNFICGNRYLECGESIATFPIHGSGSAEETLCVGVFDGMGGEECGEIASYIAAKNASVLRFGKDPSTDLLRFCQKANEAICDYAASHGINAMGTTAAILAFTKSGITLCNIGDSKIFRLSGGTLEQISKDHIAVAAFGVKPALSQNLGIPPNELIIEPYLAQGAYKSGDIYLICSDGLTDMVPTEDITNIIISASIEKASELLLSKALANGGKDNITLILCKIERQSNWGFNWKSCTSKGSEKNDK